VTSGFLRPERPEPVNRRVWLIALAVCVASGAQASDARISIPASTLDAALALLGRETGADVISTEPGLGGVRTAAVKGTMSVRTALDRLLKGSGYRAITVDARSFRVIRAAPAASTPIPAHLRPAPEPAPSDVVVTASKQHVPLLRYPGSLITIAGDGRAPSAATPDMSGVARTTPVLQTTELGPGRNKIFIRGIADSSFNGAAQSTASIYFGDVQLGYSGPDPSLKLYDMQSIDVMEGPQGTLYGSGSIGGIIRLTPNPVDLTAVGGAATAGGTVTSKGAPGFDASGMINLPIKTDVLGLRALAYRVRDGGYIDDPGRSLTNINRTDTVGGRIAMDFVPGDGWQVELGGLDQQIDGRDSQYAQQKIGTLSQSSILAQPFHNEIVQGRVVVTKNWDSGLQLLSATGYAGYNAGEQFDATTAIAVPGVVTPAVVYLTEETKSLFTHETHLSRSLPGGSSWVVGVTLLRDQDSQARSLGVPGNELDIIGVTNVTRSASVFGEATWAVAPSFSATIGLRGTLARTDGQPSTRPRSEDYVHGRSTRRLDPTAAFSWRIASKLAVFGRFQTGYRTGGIAVARGVGRVADFLPDSILVGEVGIRKLRSGSTGLALSASLSTAHWTQIQADLINIRGTPYTANIGDAKIHAAEATADWIPIRGLHVTGSALYTQNDVSGISGVGINPVNRRLPETPPFAGTAGVSYEWPIGPESVLHAGVTGSYFGRSVLGTGDLLDISQGRYGVLGLNGGWRWRRFETTLTIDNVTDARANRFAFGNPFTIAARDQVTPLRPFNMRLGFGVVW